MTVTINVTRGYLYICALLQELQKSESLLTSAETELHHVKEMNVDLKRHNTLLEQEKLKVCVQTHIIFQGHLSFTGHVNLYANMFLVFSFLQSLNRPRPNFIRVRRPFTVTYPSLNVSGRKSGNWRRSWRTIPQNGA